MSECVREKETEREVERERDWESERERESDAGCEGRSCPLRQASSVSGFVLGRAPFGRGVWGNAVKLLSQVYCSPGLSEREVIYPMVLSIEPCNTFTWVTLNSVFYGALLHIDWYLKSQKELQQ